MNTNPLAAAADDRPTTAAAGPLQPLTVIDAATTTSPTADKLGSHLRGCRNRRCPLRLGRGAEANGAD